MSVKRNGLEFDAVSQIRKDRDPRTAVTMPIVKVAEFAGSFSSLVLSFRRVLVRHRKAQVLHGGRLQP